MTTEAKQVSRDSGSAVLLGAAVSTMVVGACTAVLGAVVVGPPGARGALTGALIVLGVFATGSFVVNTVAGLMPTAALLVALMTYTLQVVAMAAVFAGLSGSGLLDETLDREWLAGAIIAGTFIWLGAQILLTTRQRIPVYDLTEKNIVPEREITPPEAPEAVER